MKDTLPLEKKAVFDEHKEYDKLLEQLEGVQQQVDQLVEKDHRDKLYLFRQLEAIEPILDKNKYKLKLTLPLHRQVKSLSMHNLLLKRRLRLVKQELIKAKESGRKRRRRRLDILVEAT